MALIQYSPWQDAAEYGAGLGRTLSQAMLQMPMLKAQQAMEQQRLGMEQGRYQTEQSQAPLQAQLLQAQIGNLNARPELAQQRLAMMDMMNQSRLEQADVLNQLRMAQIEHLENAGQPKPLTAPQNVSLEKNVQGLVPDQYQGKPQTISPEGLQFLLNAVKQGQSASAQPSQMQHVPQLQTNQVPAHLGMKLFGTVPQVTTNSFQLQPPTQQQPQQPLSGIMVNPQTGQKIQLVNGQWTPIQ